MSRYGAIIIETRPIENLDETIANKHMRFLPKEWDCLIFMTDSVYRQKLDTHPLIDEEAKNSGRNYTFAIVNSSIIQTIQDYNNTLTSKSFWEDIPFDKVLIFQSDSELLRTGIEAFVNDGAHWYGSPWNFQRVGGNGGLSLRDKSMMMKVISNFPYSDIYGNEDIYFCNHIEKVGGRVGSREMCSKFACESIFELNTFGFHAIRKWLSLEQCDAIENQYKQNA